MQIQPWIRVNGSLNRRVLDKWLGLILLFCVSHIGCTIHRVATRFNLMQPLQIRLLLEYLEDLNCIQLVTISKQKQASLWSTYQPQVIGKIASPYLKNKFWVYKTVFFFFFSLEMATDLDSIEKVFVQVQPDALTKMSLFIGDKKYTADFV